MLEDPVRHLRLLRLTAAVGISAAVCGAQPVAQLLAGLSARPSDSTLEIIGPLHDATGVLGGFGYAALITLIAMRLSPDGRVTHALAATGQRSLTCYLAQSLAWFVVFTPYLLGLADDLSVSGTALLATGVWLVTVVVAGRARAAGKRGPFETLIRRVTYGRRVLVAGSARL